MTFQNKGKLANFLGSWFPDADLERRSDAEVVQEFTRVTSISELGLVLRQLEDLLASGSFDPEDVSQEANRYFGDRAECEEWLNEIRRRLSEGLALRNGE